MSHACEPVGLSVCAHTCARALLWHCAVLYLL